MTTKPLLSPLALLLTGTALSAATLLDVPNLDFEQGLAHWTTRNAMGTAEPRAAHSGKLGLVIRDDSATVGSDLLSGGLDELGVYEFEDLFLLTFLDIGLNH